MTETMTEPGTGAEQTKARYTAIRQAIDCLEWGRHDEALVLCETLLRGKPDCAEALYVAGLVSFELDEPLQALKLIGEAHQADPNFLEAVEALAAIHAMLGQTPESLYYAKLGTILEPHAAVEGLLIERLGSFFRNIDQGHAHLYLGRAKRHLASGKVEEAIKDCETQLELTPGDPATLRLMALACRTHGQNARAIAASHALLHGDGARAEDLGDLAQALDASGRPHEAEACYREAIVRAPEDPALHARLLHGLERRPDIDQEQLDREQRRWQARHAAAYPDRAAARRKPWRGQRPLRIGYLSGAFVEGHVMPFFEPILRAHDRTRVEAYCYADGGQRDSMTERLMRLADRWTDIHKVDDETVWQILQGDEIDIAVDLSGTGPGARPLVLARRPAPVTASWLGATHPPPVPGLDYFLTDHAAWPDSAAEKALNGRPYLLSPGLLAYQPPALIPDVGTSPAVQSGRPTFGVQCDLSAVDAATVGQWASVLRGVPGAQFLICNVRNQDDACITRALDCISHFGLRNVCDVINHQDNFRSEFDFYQHIDIAFDSGRPEGAIEVCRALWMGVPVLAMRGSRHATRLAASLLSLAGQPEWAAEDVESLTACAQNLTQDPERLAELRGSLRAATAQSDLGDMTGFARGLENAYADIYARLEASDAVTPS